MVNTPAVYPTSVTTFTVKQNKIDVYNDDHINKLQNEVVALQTYVGTNPHGDQSTLSLRLRHALSGSGGFVLTTGVPTTTFPGLFYYRSDSDTLFNIKVDNTPQAVGGSITNVVFQYSAALNGTGGNNCGEIVTSSPSPADTTLANSKFRFMYSYGSTERTIYTTKFRKINGMTSVTNHHQLWVDGGTGTIRTVIGSVNSSLATAGTTFGVWGSSVVDVSGLSNGTVYDVVIMGKNTGAGNFTYMGTMIGIVQ